MNVNKSIKSASFHPAIPFPKVVLHDFRYPEYLVRENIAEQKN